MKASQSKKNALMINAQNPLIFAFHPSVSGFMYTCSDENYQTQAKWRKSRQQS